LGEGISNSEGGMTEATEPTIPDNACFSIPVSKVNRDAAERMLKFYNGRDALSPDEEKERNALSKIVNGFDKAAFAPPLAPKPKPPERDHRGADWLHMQLAPSLGGKRDIKILGRYRLGLSWVVTIGWHEHGFLKRESLVAIFDPDGDWEWPEPSINDAKLAEPLP
jgi:hypothetical protein